MSRTATNSRGVQVALLAIIALSALLLSIVAMHASVVEAHSSAAHEHTAMTTAAPSAVSAGHTDVVPSSDHAMGDMNLADCLLLGMICFLTAIAVLILGVLTDRIRSLLRPRTAAQSLAQTLRTLRPPEPPSLLVLSVSRT